MQITHIQMEKLQPVLAELGEKKHPLLAYRVTLLNQALKPFMEALKAARQPDSKFQEFSTKHTALCEASARKDVRGNVIKQRIPVPEQNGWMDNYDIEDMEAYQEGVKELNEEYKQVLEDEAARQKTVSGLLTTPVDLELEANIKYSWCRELLTGNIMTLLLECGILVMDEEPADEALVESDEETPEETKE